MTESVIVRFRRPEKIVTAIQYNGDWQAVRDALGWTIEQLIEAWPEDAPIVYPGWWLIVDGDALIGVASANGFDGWEQVA